MSAKRLPGQPHPAYLDKSFPGDFGFDPLGLVEVPENFERYKESELIHCKWAMLVVPGATYLGNPIPWGNLQVILAMEAFSIAFVEAQRGYEKDQGKQKYPGGPFDLLNFSKNPKQFEECKLKELKNGRLALLAFMGFSVQAAALPGTSPWENFFTHLADP
ncbi:hypothetical protein GOP47_0014290 [Adiantum capillus-veneris]|uniref:Chlorophyll a-b binding protein, chloroplastic n=1 Tax=Adiantum capillus-veneris TaxID=13818 RepID=A0A9D4ULH7_ADICA|nr:hypothetical protein GOP47_0014290 [Adiantum capillus-veneris]